MNKIKRKYYRYLGWCDGSGCPSGIVIKCYTDKQYERLKNDYRLIEMICENCGQQGMTESEEE